MSFYRNNINDKLNIKNLSQCIELINTNSEKFVGKGTQGEVYKVESNSCGSAIVKKKIIKKNKLIDKSNFEKECKISLLATRMINSFICPNFVQSVYYSLKNLILVMEYADGDSRFLFEDNFFKTEIYETYFFQSFVGLLCFNNYLLLHHQDMKAANILYKKIDENIIFNYNINNINYYVPTYGYLFMLADFGNSTFSLNGGFNDLTFFKFKIIKILMKSLLDLDPQMKKKYQNLFDNFENETIYLKYTKINKTILNIIDDFIEDFKKSKNKINKYVLKILDFLNSTNDIMTVLRHFFNKYQKNMYEEKNIVKFTINLHE
jgi:serine/threonine protein kinase